MQYRRAMARIGKQITPSCRQAMPVQVIEGALRVRVRTRKRTQNHCRSRSTKAT